MVAFSGPKSMPAGRSAFDHTHSCFEIGARRATTPSILRPATSATGPKPTLPAIRTPYGQGPNTSPNNSVIARHDNLSARAS